MSNETISKRAITALALVSLLSSFTVLHAQADGGDSSSQPVPDNPHEAAPAKSPAVVPEPTGVFSLPPGAFGHYLLAPRRLSTTLNIDGERAQLNILGSRYQGVRLTHVGPKGVAKTAGLAPGDILLSLNSHTVASADLADQILNQLPSGDLNVVFARNLKGNFQMMETRIRYINPYREGQNRYFFHLLNK